MSFTRSVARYLLFGAATTTGLVARTSGADILNVPADYATIQDAIDAALPGDTVVVSPGVYPENINFLGKSITVASAQGAASTTIDGGAADSVVKFVSGEGPSSVLRGFTVRNGDPSVSPCFSDGGGICISGSSPTIEDNRIVDNVACAGAGISIAFGSPLIQRNTISGNRQAGCSGGTGGGGIVIRGDGLARIIGNVISGNSTFADGGGISGFAAGSPTIEGNVIQGNSGRSGGGINLVNRSDASILNNLIIENLAQEGGGIAFLVPSGTRGPRVLSNTIADNQSPLGSGILADGFDEDAEIVNNVIVAAPGQTAVFCGNFNDPNPPEILFNNVFSPSGPDYGGICGNPTGTNGNISADPLFRNAGGDDYRLLSGSPSIDAGDNTVLGLPPNDIEGKPRVLDGDGDAIAIVDMGAYEQALLLCNVDLAYEPRTLTLSFDLATTEPVSWGVWIAAFNVVAPLWSVELPAIDPAVSFDIPWNDFPSIGQVAILTTFSTTSAGLVCLDIERIDTGGLGSDEEKLNHLLLTKERQLRDELAPR